MNTAGPSALASTSTLQVSRTTGQSEANAVEQGCLSQADALSDEELAELEAQLQVEAICEVLQALPKSELWELVLNIGVPVPSMHSGERVTKMALVHAALAHLHEEMHRGADMVDYEVTVYSHVRELVEMGLVANPWSALEPSEELSGIHAYNELASYLPALSDADLRAVLDKLSCICLLDAKTRVMQRDELAEEIVWHLQHITTERRDISVEQYVIRSVYRFRSDDDDEDSESPGHNDDAESQSGGSILPAELRTTRKTGVEPGPVHEVLELSKVEMVDRIDQISAKLFALPRGIVVEIIDGVCPAWLTAELCVGYDSPNADKEAVVLQLRDALRRHALFGVALEAAVAVRDIEWAIAAFPHIDRQRILDRKLHDARRRRKKTLPRVRRPRVMAQVERFELGDVEEPGQRCDDAEEI